MKSLMITAGLAVALALGGFGLPAAQAQSGHHDHGHHDDDHHDYGHSNHGHHHHGHHHHGHHNGGGYYSGYGNYGSGYGGYRNVPYVGLGQIYTRSYVPSYRLNTPYNSGFGGGYYGSGYRGMGYSNFGTGIGLGTGLNYSSGYGYGPNIYRPSLYGTSISIGIGGLRQRF